MLIIKIGASSADNPLLKYGAKDHYFRAAICHLCLDVINCQVIIYIRYNTLLEYVYSLSDYCFIFIFLNSKL